jgi:hypothetical protein
LFKPQNPRKNSKSNIQARRIGGFLAFFAGGISLHNLAYEVKYWRG